MQFADIFDQPAKLPSIPKVVQELIETFNQDNIDMDMLATKISMDPVLTAKVLRLANSVHYGVSRTIASMSEASIVLGFSTLRTLVLASGITGAFQTPNGFDQKAFWRESFAIAAISRWLAPYSHLNPEVAFTTGMLHDIGDLILISVLPEESKKIAAAVKAGGKRIDIENAMLGYNYADIGAELARRWKFPQDIIDGIQYHAKPLSQDPTPKLAGLIYLAMYIHQGHKQKLGDEEILAEFPVNVASSINLDIHNAKEDIMQLDGIESGMDALLNN
ncbi:HDOD domain-containing protein [Bermanella sp. R86510]|uniref:HDOD domain-containing protein n=1 Tax=unclassified Bermanella TaxID=2627862 RepID=UPI0037C9A8C6